MSKAPVGAVVRIFCDGGAILVGDAIRTATGRLYMVIERRVQARGKHAGRQHLRVQVVTEVSEDTRICPLRWYRRKKRKAVFRAA
jgi:hypothetical protein